MRRFSAFSAVLFLAACSGPVEQAPAPMPSPPRPPVVAQQGGPLIGHTAGDLIATFGAPALQIREGSSLKLQFRNPSCVLDAYLYPSANGMRVTHVDTRYPSGADVDQAACIGELSARS